MIYSNDWVKDSAGMFTIKVDDKIGVIKLDRHIDRYRCWVWNTVTQSRGEEKLFSSLMAARHTVGVELGIE